MASLDQNPIPYLKPIRILTLAFVIISENWNFWRDN
jgi:hypothetical protein